MTERHTTTEIKVRGRLVRPGTEVSITGERGRFKFERHVRTAAGAEWIDVYGGPENYERERSFTPDRIKTVHRIPKHKRQESRS